jgi:flagellar motor switch protein FliN/FliY
MSEEPNNRAEQPATTVQSGVSPPKPEDVAKMTPADAAAERGAGTLGAQPESPGPSDAGGGVPERTSKDESTDAHVSAEAPQVAAPTASGNEPSGTNAVAPEPVAPAVEKAAAPAEPPVDDVAPPAGGVTVSTEEIEAAMQEMQTAERPAAHAAPADADSGGAPSELPPDAVPFKPEDFAAERPLGDPSQLDLLDDVELEVKVELGRTEMYIEDVLGLGAGSVVELDKAAGDPVDIFVNERLVARGEVLVLDDSFCVRINDIISPVPELEDER